VALAFLMFNKIFFREYIKHLLRSYPFVSRYEREVATLYAMSPKALLQVEEQRFLHIFRMAYTRSSFYHDLWSQAGISIDDISSLGDIVKLPVITKQQVRDNIEAIRIVPRLECVKAHTSGTTGMPLSLYEGWPTIWREEAYLRYYRRRCGFDYAVDELVSLRGHLDRAHSSLYIPNLHCLFLSSFDINEPCAAAYHELVSRHRPKAIEGYPSAIFSLCRLWDRMGLSCHIPFTFTSSESLDDCMRHYIEHFLDTQVYDHYGNTERTIALSETFDHQGYFEVPGYSVNQYRDDCVITTSLINEAFPLIRYRVDDVVKLSGNARSCSIAPVASKIEGRATQVIVGKDGTRYGAAALTYFAKAIPGALFVQLVQNTAGKMVVNIVPGEGFASASDGVRAAVDTLIGLENIDYSICLVDESQLVFSSSRKLSLIASSLTI